MPRGVSRCPYQSLPPVGTITMSTTASFSSSSEPAAEIIPAPPYTFGIPWPEINDGLSYTDVIRAKQSARTLIDFYSSEYKSSAPLQGWLQRIRNGQIAIDGRIVTDPETVLRVGSEVMYHRVPWKEPNAPYLLEVLYDDDDMIAINKPSGLQVLPGGLFQQRTVLTQLKWKVLKQKFASLSNKRSFCEPHPTPVHRLGRGTSGVLLCAKTKLAKCSLASYFAEGTSVVGNRNMRKLHMENGNGRRISKFYRALVTGILEHDEMVIQQPIGIMHYPGVAKGLYIASLTGKPALSKVHVLERDVQQNQTLVQVEIHSGRPHQIRIHLAFIGHPLLGDPLYDMGGCPKNFQSESLDDTFAEDGGYEKPVRPVPGDCGYYLHAHRLVLCHPSTNDTIEITAPLPPILQTKEESGKGSVGKIRTEGSF